jgi:hypothetical protein
VLYRALPQAITDLVSGIVQHQFVSPLPVFDIIATGKLRAIAVTAPHASERCRICQPLSNTAFRSW